MVRRTAGWVKSSSGEIPERAAEGEIGRAASPRGRGASSAALAGPVQATRSQIGTHTSPHSAVPRKATRQP
jgi:hypothetical protein